MRIAKSSGELLGEFVHGKLVSHFDAAQRTQFLGKLIGLYCIVMALAMATHKQATLEILTALLHDGPVLFLTGAITTIAGLAMVLGHNLWSGGALPVVVTLMGWGTLIKGMLFLFLLPESASALFLGALHYEQMFYFYEGFSLVLGLYLTYAASRKS